MAVIVQSTLNSDVYANSELNTKCPFSLFLLLGVRSLANASRARQFNPLNPPGVGWVKLF